MKLYARVDSERGKQISKSGNEYLLIDLSVERQNVGQIELYLHNDIEEQGCEENEWLLKYYRPLKKGEEPEDADPLIISQGHVAPTKTKANVK